MNASGIKLSPQQVNDLRKAQYQLSVVLQDYDKAEKCGADCAEMRALVTEAIENSQRILKEFGE